MVIYGTPGIVSGNRLNIPETGLYQISASIEWAANSVGSRNIQLLVNGGTSKVGGEEKVAIDYSAQSISGLWKLSAADYLQARVRQASGTALDLMGVVLAFVRVG